MNDDFSDVSSVISDCSYISEFDNECQSINFDLSDGSPIDVNNFNIAHYNINSITAFGRLDQLSNICATLKLNVLILTESKLDDTIPSSLITLPGYHEPIRRDRNRNGGGVLVYIAQNLIFNHKEQLQSENFEHIWVDIRVRNETFALNALYRPPNETNESHNKFLDTASNILQKLSSYNSSRKLIASDLNFGNCYCKFPTLEHKSLDSAASDLFSSFGFTQLIDIPTRITDNTMSLIDLIFVKDTDMVSCHGTLPKIADHDGVVVSYCMKTETIKQKTKVVYDYKNADIAGLIAHIKSINFELAVFIHPIIQQANFYTQVLMDAFTKFIPCKSVPIRVNDQPWSNTYTRLLLRKKNRNYQLYKKANNIYNNVLAQKNASKETLTRYINKRTNALIKSRNAANESTKANRRVKMEFYNTVNATMNNCSISPKKKFQILCNLMKNNKFSPIPRLIEKNETVDDPKQKSDIFNNFLSLNQKLLMQKMSRQF